MGRRSLHKPDELRDLILDASQKIIETNGLAGLSARAIAKQIDYSPGTLYNMFENLDDVVLHLEARMLDALDVRLKEVMTDPPSRERVAKLALAYLRFTHERPRMWNLLFEHHLPADMQLPQWYQQKLETLMNHIEGVLQPLFPTGREADLKRAARVLWAGVHGITSLSTADKLSIVSSDAATVLINDLIKTYLAGLDHAQSHA